MLTSDDVKNQLRTQMGKVLPNLDSSSHGDFFSQANKTINAIPTSLDMAEQKRKPKKKGINLPIGKLYSIGKTNETNRFEISKREVEEMKNGKDNIDEKWSEKYKRSINCNNPKGFSQKAHCQGRKKKNVSEEELKGGKGDKKSVEDLVKKYKKIKDAEQKIRKQVKKGTEVEKEHTKNDKKAKEIAIDHVTEDPKYYDKLKKIEGKESMGAGAAGGYVGKVAFADSDFVRKSFKETPKKVETKEATGSASSGSYVTTAAWAKSTSKKDWRGKSKTQIPGGKFVQIKKKCKKFPYCNQGDINALKLTSEDKLIEAISNVSEKIGIDENIIKQILLQEYKRFNS